MILGEIIKQRADAGDRDAARLLDQVDRAAPNQPKEATVRTNNSRTRARVQLADLLCGLAGERRVAPALVAQVQAEGLVDTLQFSSPGTFLSLCHGLLLQGIHAAQTADRLLVERHRGSVVGRHGRQFLQLGLACIQSLTRQFFVNRHGIIGLNRSINGQV